jgi:porphobilinogen deaminase
MIEVEGNCRTPIAAHARRGAGGQMVLVAMLAEPDGTNLRVVQRETSWPSTEQEADAFGRQAGGALRV